MLGVETKKKLKNADIQAKKEQLRIWTGFRPPATNTRPIHNQKFTGKVSSFTAIHVLLNRKYFLFHHVHLNRSSINCFALEVETLIAYVEGLWP